MKFKRLYRYCVRVVPLWVALLTALWLPTATASATTVTLVVNAHAGDDAIGTGSINAPYRTIHKALETVSSFYYDLELDLIILVYPGTYAGTLELPPTRGQLILTGSANGVRVEGGARLHPRQTLQNLTLAGGSGIELPEGGRLLDCRVEHQQGAGVRVVPAPQADAHKRVARIERCTLIDNLGPGIQINNAVATITDSKIIGNRSDSDGGGVTITASPGTWIRNSILTDNQTTDTGGAIFSSFSRLTIQDSYLGRNRSNGSGGALAAVGGQVDCYDTDWVANRCGLNNRSGGGAVRLVEVTAQLRGCLFTRNEAVYGGGLDLLSVATIVEVTDNRFEGNVALQLGGGMAVDGHGSIYIDGNRLTGNIASEFSAIFVSTNTNEPLGSNHVAASKSAADATP